MTSWFLEYDHGVMESIYGLSHVYGLWRSRMKLSESRITLLYFLIGMLWPQNFVTTTRKLLEVQSVTLTIAFPIRTSRSREPAPHRW